MGLPCVRGKALALALLQAINLARGCRDFTCSGVNVCSDGAFDGDCAAPADCPSTAIQMMDNDVIQITRWRCKVTLEQIRLALPEAVTKEGTEYTLNNKIWLRHGSILEIHGESSASSPDTAVSLLKLKVRDRQQEKRGRESEREKSCAQHTTASRQITQRAPSVFQLVGILPPEPPFFSHLTRQLNAVHCCGSGIVASYVHSSDERLP